MSQPLPELNFGDIYDAVAERFAGREVLVCGERTYLWRELDERSNRLARNLAALGLNPNSKIAFYLRNSPAYVELWVACTKGRFVHANVNYRYVDHELHYLIDNSDAEVVVYDAEFRPHVEALRGRLDKVRSWIEVGEGSPPDFALSFESLCIEGDHTRLDIKRSGDDLYFMYTGGTTGLPKAVMWPARERIAVIRMTQAKTVEEHIELLSASAEFPVALPAAPLMHSTGLTTMMSTLVQGGKLVLLPGGGFDAAACLSEIDRNAVTRLAIVGDAFAVPLVEVLRQQGHKYDLDSVNLISSAGAMWSEPLKRELLEYFPNALISDSLGASEGSGLGSSVMKRGETIQTGRFQIAENSKVFREDFTEIEPGSGEAGMLATSGALPLGYYKDPAKTAETYPVIDGVRYSMAGDWCRVEADGTMTLLGRGNNCINSGGEKIYPEEVEEALKQMPEVVDAAVLGVADERWGQTVAAVIRTREGESIPADYLRSQLEGYVARYKHPRQIVYLSSDFRHANGKINYREVKRIMDEHLAAAR